MQICADHVRACIQLVRAVILAEVEDCVKMLLTA